MDYSDPTTKSKGLLVGGLVLVGVGVLGAGVVVAIKKGSAQQTDDPGGIAQEEVQRWCALRREWAQRVDPLSGDIVLKSAQDEQAAGELVAARNRECQRYAKKVRDLKVADPRIAAVELALVKEGKVRANVAVEIANALTQLGSEDTETLRRALKTLEAHIRKRIRDGRAEADGAVAGAMRALPGCAGVYRGPMTDAGTADDPYISWDELGFRRTLAIKKINEKMVKLAPREEWSNRVHHQMISRYRREFKKCYAAARRRTPKMSTSVGLRVRLKRAGKVASLGIEWMDVPDPKFLDCLLEDASKWTLPRPPRDGDYVVVNIDLSAL